MKVMVASTIRNFEEQISQICAVLTGYGYEVLNSHYGTIRTNPNGSNLEDCLQAVRECDVFLGLIRPFYGSGVIGETSITHEEMRLALTLDKPRWILVHEHVDFLRQLLKNNSFVQPFNKTPVVDDLRVVDIYNEMLQHGVPVEERRNYWVQPFTTINDALRYMDRNFKDTASIERIVESSRIVRRGEQ